MTPTILSRLKPLGAISAVSVIDSAVRLSLSPALDRRAVVDGVWWPYSRDAAAELPGLIAAVDQRLGRATLSVGMYRDAWEHIPRHVPARGRQVQVGCFHQTDPRVVVLSVADAKPIVLLVIPPGTAKGSATAALTTHDAAGLGEADILTGAHQPATSPAGPADVDGWADWENEGGHLADQRSSAPSAG
ncbi:DUF5994 family protein [Nonomuraea sp. NPDC000554]|uniref:DUF5994 family protein n=1 Tax=Nonomuraea sp. NPDC000554 TaxID=3154259 RepID=UPI0033276172